MELKKEIKIAVVTDSVICCRKEVDNLNSLSKLDIVMRLMNNLVQDSKSEILLC